MCPLVGDGECHSDGRVRRDTIRAQAARDFELDLLRAIEEPDSQIDEQRDGESEPGSALRGQPDQNECDRKKAEQKETAILWMIHECPMSAERRWRLARSPVPLGLHRLIPTYGEAEFRGHAEQLIEFSYCGIRL